MSTKSKDGFWSALSSFLLPITTPTEYLPHLHQAAIFLQRQERMERQNLIMIELLKQIRDRL
jgi:hypothetical protein